MTKRRHNRLTRLVFRLGVAVCLLIVAVSVVSFWWSFEVVTYDRRRVSIAAGSLVVLEYEEVGRVVWIRSDPLWMPLLAAMVPTFLAWRKLRQDYPPGHCRKCGYNLTGNVSGKCSECGAETEGDK